MCKEDYGRMVRETRLLLFAVVIKMAFVLSSAILISRDVTKANRFTRSGAMVEDYSENFCWSSTNLDNSAFLWEAEQAWFFPLCYS